ncbi:MAG: AgmX/PglI C-terminal domain-containing protein [Myxococcales bacterium]|nr:AgmX/PglI C-terminal domain-containing protein [Myxococcales bacterium]
MALDTTRVLRIGVVFRGQIVAERVLDRRVDITVGSRPDCTVQVNAKDYPDFPVHVALALLHGGAYHAVVPAERDADLTLRGGAPGAAESAKARAVTIKGTRAVPIDAFTGGSVARQDIILMFQFVRGDSVPTVTREETVLRIGLVHDDRLLSDQVFRGKDFVTIGTSGRSTIALPDVEYKGSPAVFTPPRGTSNYTVALPRGCGVRLALDGALPIDEKEAIQKGLARLEGDTLQLSLPLKARGRASLGPYTLLFQILKQTITVPAVPRKSLLGQLASPFVADSAWTVSVAIAFLLVGSIVGQAILFHRTTGKFLKKSAIEEELANSTYEVLVEEKEPEKEDKPKIDILSAQAKKEQEKEKDEEKKKVPPKEKPQSVGKQIDPEELKRQAREAVVKRSIAGALVGSAGAATKLFGAAGDGEEGTVVAKTFGGDSGGDDLNGPGGALKLEGGGGGGGTMEKVAGGGAKGFGERDADATKVEAKKQEQLVKIDMQNFGMEGSGEGKADVAKVISRKNSAVQRCYEMALKDSPDLSGKVKVMFIVGTAGTITEVSVGGATGSFEDCIKSKFSAIRGLPILPSPQSFSQSYVFTKG